MATGAGCSTSLRCRDREWLRQDTATSASDSDEYSVPDHGGAEPNSTRETEIGAATSWASPDDESTAVPPSVLAPPSVQPTAPPSASVS